MDLLNVQLLVLISCGLKGTQATLVTNVSVACPGDVVTFSCTVSGNLLRWTVDPPPSSGYVTLSNLIDDSTALDDPLIIGSDSKIQFKRTRIEASQGQLRSTLSTCSGISISTYNGTTVNCNDGMMNEKLKIQVADSPPSTPEDVVLTFQNRTSVSVATLQWSPPTYTGGVDVSYVLTISSPTSPESSNTTDSSSMEISVTYNIEYNITIRADNCVGSSQDVLMVFKLVACPSSPSTANGVVLTNIPSVTTEGSTLTITCSNNNDIVPSTCGSDGRWSPDPGDYDCVVPTTVNCATPSHPAYGAVLNYDNIQTTEASLITFQCAMGFSPDELMTATCTNAGLWMPDPANVECSYRGNGPSTAPLATGEAVGISIVVTFVISVVIGLVVGVLVTYFIMNRKMKELTERQSPSQQPPVPAGPVYEEVSLPKENIELESNQAYGPVGQ